MHDACNFGVSSFYPQQIQERTKVYEAAIGADNKPGDANATKEQVQFSFQNESVQVILEDQGVMARVFDAKGSVVGIERGGVDDLEVAQKTAGGFTSQIAKEDPNSGDGWYTPRSMAVSDQANPEKAFKDLNAMFESKWKMAK